jgi:hypothetical protein
LLYPISDRPQCCNQDAESYRDMGAVDEHQRGGRAE